MCGISGIINSDSSKICDKNILEKVTHAVAHRGPDGYGFWTHNNIGFGHRRLSIIDLKAGNQPMQAFDNKLSITFNGEIYNYLDLKKELQKRGYAFKTNSDTEVILVGYKHWGKAIVNHLRGMFSFAIADMKNREVFIVRDHFGIKPLLYYRGTDFCMFGSEIQQFHKHPQFKKDINVSAMAEYLKYGYIPAPLTIFNNLHKLEPGNYLRLNFEGRILEKTEYYDVKFNPNNKVSYSEWVERVEEAINTSVNYHKIADVSYGSFLSGGIDSSLIASSLAEKGQKVAAFTMGFANKDFDEVPYAKQVAQMYNLNHHIDYVNMEGMQDIFPKLIQHYGEPFADSSAIPTYYITKKIREYLPVVLSGDGGDEAFGGYYSYQNFLKILNPNPPKEHYKNTLKRLLKYVGKTYASTPKNPDLKDWINLIAYNNDVQLQKLFKPEVYKEIDSNEDVFAKWYKKAKDQKLDTYSLASYMDYKTYIHSDILTKVDIAAMMNSLEVRTPLIDVEVVNLMAQIPAKHKISRNYDGSWQKKKILNSIASKRFGEGFIKRKKQGFTVPLQDWFGKNTVFGTEFNTIITDKKSYIFNYLNFEAVQELFLNKQQFNFSQLYLLFNLERWLKNN
ncbi:MAG: asparagine synthase (glutamine-hydrolyzing) [Flavobacteriaceae bacterium]|nr:asparagine synthase (glutamine-hydrolyzing) [Flavobacteriaceae bacterium]